MPAKKQKTKSNFVYLSSWDELTWTIDTHRNFYRCTIPWAKRLEVRDWIEANLDENVYCWNGTSSPMRGSTQWHFVTPDENQTWLMFASEDEEPLFALRFSDCIEQVHRNGNSAWWESRK